MLPLANGFKACAQDNMVQFITILLPERNKRANVAEAGAPCEREGELQCFAFEAFHSLS